MFMIGYFDHSISEIIKYTRKIYTKIRQDIWLDREIKEIAEKYEKFYIYSSEKTAALVQRLLRKYRVVNYVTIDCCSDDMSNRLYKELAGKQWSDKEVVIIASNDYKIYTYIRSELKKYVPLSNIKDMFPMHPLMKSGDQRIVSLAVVAKEIYRKNISGSVAEGGGIQGRICKIYQYNFSR